MGSTEWLLPRLDPPTEPSTVLEMNEALFSWDLIGTSQKTFISHLEVKKVHGTDTPGEFPDKQTHQGLMLNREGRKGGAWCLGSSLRGNDPFCVHLTSP